MNISCWMVLLGAITPELAALRVIWMLFGTAAWNTYSEIPVLVLFRLSATIFSLPPSWDMLKVTRRPCLLTAMRGGMAGAAGAGTGSESRPSRSMRRSLLVVVVAGAGGWAGLTAVSPTRPPIRLRRESCSVFCSITGGAAFSTAWRGDRLIFHILWIK